MSHRIEESVVLKTGSDELDFDWTEPGILGDAFVPRIHALQHEAPVFWSARQNAWIVTGHREIIEGLRDARFSNFRMHMRLEHVTKEAGLPEGPLLTEMRRWIFNQDGPDHARLRKLLMAPFSKSKAERHRIRAQEIFDGIVAGVANRHDVEFLTEVAMPFASAVLLDVVGLGHIADAPKMLEWGNSIAEVFGPIGTDTETIARADRTIVELTAILHDEIALRRREPRQDLLTDLIQLVDHGDRLTEDEIVRLFHVLILAGFETTANTLTLSVISLDQDPAARDYIRANPDNMVAIVEELQRQVGMSGVQTRLAVEDVDWFGQPVRAGDVMFFVLAAGNWDQSVFPDPRRILFDRERKLPTMFGPGLHHCLGHNLAKVWLEVAIGTLFENFDRIRLLDDDLIYTSNIINRTVPHLNVHFDR